ncbi:hypothetical protein AMECASPLE_024859 [Ameca splendens]|uniref:Uncharacterized protein n=1 Tax=Ameca splendens TaxID=208324 RepID=A0ABV0YRT7_9TELE
MSVCKRLINLRRINAIWMDGWMDGWGGNGEVFYHLRRMKTENICHALEQVVQQVLSSFILAIVGHDSHAFVGMIRILQIFIIMENQHLSDHFLQLPTSSLDGFSGFDSSRNPEMPL